MHAADAFALSLRDDLLAGAVQGGLLVLAVWLACHGPAVLGLRGRVAGRIPPAVQAWLWWLACARLIVALLPIPAVSLPFLPADTGAVISGMPVSTSPAAIAIAQVPERRPAGEVAGPAPAPVSWVTALLALWFVGIALHAARVGGEYVHVRRIVRRSAPASVESTRAANRVAARFGMVRVPEVRSSADIATPQTLGVRRPIVLLPADADAALSSSERAMVLAHELMHVRRRDVALGWVPAVAERLFFFHPLARLAAREYLVAREAACDAGAIEALGIAPARYGEMLVAIGVHRPVASFAASSGAWSSSSLKRRLEMLQYSRRQRVSTFARWSFAVAACACLMPFQLVARPAGWESPGPSMEMTKEMAPQTTRAVGPPPAASAPARTATAVQSAETDPALAVTYKTRQITFSGNAVSGAAAAAAMPPLERRAAAGVDAPERNVAAGLQARFDAQDTAAAAEAGRRREAEMSAMLERLARRVEGLPQGHADRARAEAEVEGLRRALSELQSDDVHRAIRETVEAASREAAAAQQVERELGPEIERALEALARETNGLVEERAELELERQREMKLRTDEATAELSRSRDELLRQIAQLKTDQEALRRQQQELQRELERLRAEMKK